MRCAKNLINSITPPMNAKINPQIFSVLGVKGFSGVSSLWEILNGNCDAMGVKIYHSLKSPLCSCVSITLPRHRRPETRLPDNGYPVHVYEPSRYEYTAHHLSYGRCTWTWRTPLDCFVAPVWSDLFRGQPQQKIVSRVLFVRPD
jgi:hypothetical protein